jgi:Na+/melibiose symporter-like transporter
MHSTARVYFDATVALATMATFGVIAGFVAIAATGDRMLALSATLVAFVLAGIVAVIRLWRSMREPMRPTKPGAAAES